MFPKSGNQDENKIVKLPSLMACYLRWIIVLAKLRELEFANRSQASKLRSVGELVAELQLEILLPESPNSLVDEEPEVKLSRESWEKWFSGGNKSDKSSPFFSVYQCRYFLELDAPNNLVQKFNNIIKGESTNANKTRDLKSNYAEYCLQWGKYAEELVRRNGGWQNFAAKQNLADVIDVWVGSNAKRRDEKLSGKDRDSFIQRILYLSRDRYVQILTSTVAMLWPLWFLKRSDNMELLRKITSIEQDKSQYLWIGKTLPSEENELYIDINTRQGDMAGMPYPFGLVDEFLSKYYEKNPDLAHELETAEPWPSKVVLNVTEALKELKWCPPLLLGARGEEFEQPDDKLKNYRVPYIAIANPCNVFTSIYRHKNAKGKTLENMVVGYEAKTYGERILLLLKDAMGCELKTKTFTRFEMAKDFQSEDVDIIFSYFPVNILLQTNENYELLSVADMYSSFGAYANFLSYDLPSIVLVGGMRLAEQANMRQLLIDCAGYIQKVEYLFGHLRPEWKSLQNKFIELRLTNGSKKKHIADSAYQTCSDVAQKAKLVKDKKLVPAEAIPTYLKRIGREMSKVLYEEDDETNRSRFQECFESWGWALLLEFVKYTSVFLSVDMF